MPDLRNGADAGDCGDKRVQAASFRRARIFNHAGHLFRSADAGVGWDFTLSEFARFWYLVLALALGFGIQIGLYTDLKQRLIHHHTAGKVVATSGATSTIAMISCCAHYLVNVLPIVGAAGLVTLVAEYQIELFWVGLAFNAGGIAFIASRIWRAGKHV